MTTKVTITRLVNYVPFKRNAMPFIPEGSCRYNRKLRAVQAECALRGVPEGVQMI